MPAFPELVEREGTEVSVDLISELGDHSAERGDLLRCRSMRHVSSLARLPADRGFQTGIGVQSPMVKSEQSLWTLTTGPNTVETVFVAFR